jgi:paraquat-inducible protein B
MTDRETRAGTGAVADGLPADAVVERRKPRIPIIWLIPLLAVAIAGWLFYRTLSEEGPTITLSFQTAEGLEAGKTLVKHKNVDLGVVDSIHLVDDLSHVVVTARMDRDAAPHLKTDTRFWVVKPRLTAAGISGLGTLVSGAYIEMEPGEGDPSRTFVGLEVPPVVRSDVPGTEYTLKARRLPSISIGSPIYFRGIQVGEVMGYAFAEDKRDIDITVFIKAPHDQIIRDGSRFWNASGIDMSLSAEGVRVSTESLQAVLSGGIAFETPINLADGPQSVPHTAFRLYDSYETIAEAQYTEKIPYLLHFDGSVRGLSEGAPVEFRGMKIGAVSEVRLEYDPKAQTVRIPVIVNLEPERIRMVHETETGAQKVMEALVDQGLRAQLVLGNLITGQLAVALDFFPDEPAQPLDRSGKYPEIPTVPSDIQAITRSTTGILNKIASLPLDDLVNEMRATIDSTRALITSPALTGAIESLQQVQPLLESIRGTMEAAEATLRRADSAIGSVGAGSPVQQDVVQLLSELKGAARALRVLADYLERHPEALIRGKGSAP